MARVDYDRMAPDYVEGRVLPPEGMEPGGRRSGPGCPLRGRAGRRCSTLAPGPGSSRPPSPAGSGSRWSPSSRRARCAPRPPAATHTPAGRHRPAAAARRPVRGRPVRPRPGGRCRDRPGAGGRPHRPAGPAAGL